MPRTHARRRSGGALYLEVLEERRLLSGFAYDLRFAPGQEGVSADLHSVDLSQPHLSSYTLQLWAQITGDTNLSNDVFTYGYVSIASTQVDGNGALTGGGITNGRVNSGIFNLVPTNGTAANITNDGIGDWGSADSSSVNGWLFWANADSHTIDGNQVAGYLDGTAVSGQSQPVASDSTNSWEVLVATFTVNVSSVETRDTESRSTVFNVYLPAGQSVDGQADVGAHIDGAQSLVGTAQLGPGVAFDLPSLDRESLSFSESLFANSTQAFSAADFSNAFWDGTFGGSLQGVEITALPAHGTLTLNTAGVTAGEVIPLDELGELVYTPQANYVGSDAFSWNGTDGSGYGDSAAQVNLTVSADPPPVIGNVVVNPGATLPYGYTFATADFTSQFSDTVAGDTMQSITITALPAAGTLKLSGVPVAIAEQIPVASLPDLSYTPGDSFAGADSFSWIATDGTGVTSNTGTVTLAANGPILAPLTVETGYGTAFDFSSAVFGAAYSDGTSNQPLAMVVIQSLPAHGTLELNGSPVSAGAQISAAALSGLTYTPEQSLNRRDSFTWAAFDGHAFSFHEASVNIQVTGTPTLPAPARAETSPTAPPPPTAQHSGPTAPGAGDTPAIIHFMPAEVETAPAPQTALEADGKPAALLANDTQFAGALDPAPVIKKGPALLAVHPPHRRHAVASLKRERASDSSDALNAALFGPDGMA